MPEVLPGNGLQSTLANSITSGATTLSIQAADASKWPASGQYRAVLCQDPTNGPWEIVLVTGGQGTATLTVTRAAEPYNGVQTAQAWPTSTGIAAVLTHDGLGGSFLPLAGGTLNGGLLFSPDSTYDIGASGATRPANLWLGGNANISGNVGIGLAATTSSALTVVPNATLVGTTQYGVTAWPIFSSAATVMGAAVAAQSGTANVAFTQAESTDFLALGPNFGAASTITNAIGFHANNQGGARVTNAYGIYIDAQSGAGTLNIGLYNAGTTNLVGGLIGNLIFSPDNTFDIGAAAATRPRNVYAGTAFIGNGSLPIGGTTGQVLAKNTATNYDVAWTAPGAPTYPLRGPADTAAAPDFSWTASTSTGLYSPAANSVGLSANSTAILTATSALVTLPVAVSLSSTLAVTGTSQLTGNVGIGAASGAASGLLIAPNQTLTGTAQNGLNVSPTFASSATTSGAAATIKFNSQATTFTMATGYGLYVAPPSVGAGNTVTTLYGLRVDNQGAAGVTNAYGLYIAAQSGAATTNIGLYIAGGTTYAIQVNSGACRLQNISLDQGLGTNPNTWQLCNAGGTLTGAATQMGMNFRVNADSTCTAQLTGFTTQLGTAAGSYTLPAATGYYCDGPIVGAGTTITTVRGMLINNLGGAGITNAYGIVISAQSGAATTNIGLWNQGTTQLAGTVSIGPTAPLANAGLDTLSLTLAGNTTQVAILGRATGNSSATAEISGFLSSPATAASAFTCAALIGVHVSPPTKGASSTVTSNYGILVDAQSVGNTNNYGIFISQPSGGSGSNIGLVNQGTTQLASNVGIGNAPAAGFALQIAGAGLLSGVNQFGLSVYPTFSSAATSQGRALDGQVITAATTFTMAAGYAVYANPPSLGAGSAITSAYGLFASNQGAAGVTNAYGVYIAAQSGAATNNIGLVNLGTSQLQGGVLVGGGQPPPASGLIVMGATPATTNTGMVGIGHTFQNPGGGAAATLGTIGGSGPTAAAMNQWWQITVDGSTRFVPLWA